MAEAEQKKSSKYIPLVLMGITGVIVLSNCGDKNKPARYTVSPNLHGLVARCAADYKPKECDLPAQTGSSYFNGPFYYIPLAALQRSGSSPTNWLRYNPSRFNSHNDSSRRSSSSTPLRSNFTTSRSSHRSGFGTTSRRSSST